MIELTEQKIDVGEVYRRMEDPACGAVVVFVGRVRNHNDGHAVQALRYTAYRDMVVAEGDRILAEARGQFQIRRALIHHGIGELKVGDISVIVGVASEHRADAFQAAAWIMDQVKERLPVWKEEWDSNGQKAWSQNRPSF